MRDIELASHEFRSTRRPKVKFTFFEAASFAIGSTLATRKRTPPDKDRNARLMSAVMLGVVTYFTSGGG